MQTPDSNSSEAPRPRTVGILLYLPNVTVTVKDDEPLIDLASLALVVGMTPEGFQELFMSFVSRETRGGLVPLRSFEIHAVERARQVVGDMREVFTRCGTVARLLTQQATQYDESVQQELLAQFWRGRVHPLVEVRMSEEAAQMSSSKARCFSIDLTMQGDVANGEPALDMHLSGSVAALNSVVEQGQEILGWVMEKLTELPRPPAPKRDAN